MQPGNVFGVNANKDSPTDLQEIGQRLSATRAALDLTQAAIAKTLGIRRHTYTQWELGVRRPNLDDAIRLARAYRLSLDWIYLGDHTTLPEHLYQRIAAAMRRRRLTKSD